MRALLALVAFSTGCDQLFQIDEIAITDAAQVTGPPTFLAMGATAHAGDGTPYPTVSAALGGPIDAGSLVVVALCSFPPTGEITLRDSAGSMYTHVAIADAAVPTPALAASLYYTIVPNAAGALKVDVDFAGIGAESPDVRIAAYSNISTAAPFETAAVTSQPMVMSLEAAVTVTAVPSLLVATTCVGDQTTSIDGYQIRTLTQPNGDALGDALSDTPSDEIATANQGGTTGMIVQLAAFRGVDAR